MSTCGGRVNGGLAKHPLLRAVELASHPPVDFVARTCGSGALKQSPFVREIGRARDRVLDEGSDDLAVLVERGETHRHTCNCRRWGPIYEPRAEPPFRGAARALDCSPKGTPEPRPVRATRLGDGPQQRLDREVGLGTRQQGCRAVTDGRIGKERDQPVAPPRCGPPQDRERTLLDLLIARARGVDQGIDRRVMILGQPGERAEGPCLSQQGKSRPGIANLLGRPLSAGPENVHRCKRLVVVGVEISDGVHDPHGIRACRRSPGPGRQRQEGR
jgi:hypothetical protein